MEKQEFLKQQAVGLGLCTQWQDEWGQPSDIELIQKYIRGIDFCIKHNFPSNEYIKRNVDVELLHLNGIFVDETINISRNNPQKILILNGMCVGSIDVDGFSIRTIYIRGDSCINITAKGFSRTFIRVYDNARVNVIANGGAKAFVYRHGGNISGSGYVLRDKEEKGGS